MSEIFTIGYEAAEISDFLETLSSAGIERLLDVRAVPASRRQGFSKNALQARLNEIGIEYTALQSLGDPKPGRDAARAGRHNEFRAIYSNHLKTEKAQAALDTARQLAIADRCCLLCYEFDPLHCHRTMIAANLACRYGIGVTHLYVDSTIGRSHEKRLAQRRNRSPREGLTAA